MAKWAEKSKPATSQMLTAAQRRAEDIAAGESIRPLIPPQYFRPEVENSGDYYPGTKALKAAELYIRAQARERDQAVGTEIEAVGVEVGEPAEEVLPRLRVRKSARPDAGVGKSGRFRDKGKRKRQLEGREEDEPPSKKPTKGRSRSFSHGLLEDVISDKATQTPPSTATPTATPPSAYVSALSEIQQLRQCAQRLVQTAETKAEEAGEGKVSEDLKQTIEQGSNLMIDLIEVIEQQGWSEEMKAKWENEREEWVRWSILKGEEQSVED